MIIRGINVLPTALPIFSPGSVAGVPTALAANSWQSGDWWKTREQGVWACRAREGKQSLNKVTRLKTQRDIKYHV